MRPVKRPALLVLVALLCGAVPAVAGNIAATDTHLQRGSRGSGPVSSLDAAEGTSEPNTFSDAYRNQLRPDRPHYMVNHGDDGTVLDGDTPTIGTHPLTPVPPEGGDPSPNGQDPATAPVPEPATLALVAPAVFGLYRKLKK